MRTMSGLVAMVAALGMLAVACAPGGARETVAAEPVPASSTTTRADVPTAVATPTPVVSPEAQTTATPAGAATPGVPQPAAQPQTPAPASAPLNVQTVPREVQRLAPLPRIAGTVRTVALDPGHGGAEVGAAASGVVEKESNLEMALRVEALLQAQGVRVQMTRRTDERAYVGAQDGGFNSTRRDLQARIDLANDAGAELFVSIHSNGSVSGVDRGIETYYNSQRPFAEQNRALASTLQAAVIAEVSAAGYSVVDRGAKDDACLRAFQGRCFPLFVLGPSRVTTIDEVLRRGGDPATFGFAPGTDAVASRATAMPGALVELLFVSNPADATLLRTEEARAAIALGVTRGILEFLARTPRAG